MAETAKACGSIPTTQCVDFCPWSAYVCGIVVSSAQAGGMWWYPQQWRPRKGIRKTHAEEGWPSQRLSYPPSLSMIIDHHDGPDEIESNLVNNFLVRLEHGRTSENTNAVVRLNCHCFVRVVVILLEN